VAVTEKEEEEKMHPMMHTAEFARAMQDEMQKNMARWSNWMSDFVVNPGDPPMAQTPKEVVWKRGKIQLYRYLPQTEQRHPWPYFMVPWLGISRPYILDMLPGHSMIEYLVQQGHDVYLLDWGIIAEEDKNLGLEDIVFKILPRAIDEILDLSQAQALNLNGFCLGGVITNCYLSLNPQAPVKNYIAIVTPVDFAHGGLFKTWLGHATFPADLMVDQFGGVPTHLMAMGFKMLRPTGDAIALSGLWLNLDKKEYIPIFKAMHRWANDFVGMPGRFFRQLQKELYFQNRLLKGELMLKGCRVDLRNIHQPLFVAAAAKDHIVPPLAAKGLMDAVASTDKEFIELPGGHISVFSGRQAHKVLWPRLHEWVMQRSAA
jgi:polyhydroxyalkanoate synthase